MLLMEYIVVRVLAYGAVLTRGKIKQSAWRRFLYEEISNVAGDQNFIRHTLRQWLTACFRNKAGYRGKGRTRLGSRCLAVVEIDANEDNRTASTSSLSSELELPAASSSGVGGRRFFCFCFVGDLRAVE